MGIFSTIRDAIFGRAQAAPRPAPAAPAPAATPTPAPAAAAPAPAPAPAPQPVDIEKVLTDMAAHDGRDLNWRTSIVDLMKLVGMESSLAERKDLAQELGYTGALDGSAEMNMWLHRRVMQELAANGGHVPASMLD